MTTLGQRLKECRKEKGITQGVVSKAVGMSHATLSELEGDAYPSSSYLPMLARYYGVDAYWLATGKGSKDTSIATSNLFHGKVPLISLADAKNWHEFVDNLSGNKTSTEYVKTTVSVNPHTYAVCASGDSMEPRLFGGDLLIVEPDEVAQNGSFVIVSNNGSEAVIRQLTSEGGQMYLKPLNSRYPIVAMQNGDEICGVVKQMFMDF